jgi:hypothetical protein
VRSYVVRQVSHTRRRNNLDARGDSWTIFGLGPTDSLLNPSELAACFGERMPARSSNGRKGAAQCVLSQIAGIAVSPALPVLGPTPPENPVLLGPARRQSRRPQLPRRERDLLLAGDDRIDDRRRQPGQPCGPGDLSGGQPLLARDRRDVDAASGQLLPPCPSRCGSRHPTVLSGRPMAIRKSVEKPVL